MGSKYTREHFIENMKEGNIIAFEINDQMQTGKIIEITEAGDVTVKTKNCSIYFIKTTDVKWVKTGSNWPTGIYNAIKYSHK